MAHYGPEQWWYSDGSAAASVRAAVFEGDQSTLAAIFSDSGLSVPLTNPTTTDASGFLEFYAADGDYWIFVGNETYGDSVLSTLGPAPTGAVVSVNGQSGVVLLGAADVGAQPIATINAKGDLYAGTGNDATTRRSIGTDGQVLTADSGDPTGMSWQAGGGGGAVTSVNGQTGVVVLTASNVGAAPSTRVLTAGIALSGGGDLSADRTFDVDLGTTAGTAAAGDDTRIVGAQQRSTLTTKGDLYAATAAATTTRQPVGTDGQVLTADSAQSTGIKWATVASAPVTSVNGQTGVVVLTAANVGAIASTLPDAKGDIITATAADTPARLAVGTNGQALRANSATATGLEWDTLDATDVGADAAGAAAAAQAAAIAASDPVGSAAAAAAASQPIATINAKGDLYAGTADNATTRQPVGTDGQVLRAASGQATGLEYHTLTASDVGALDLTGGTITGDVLFSGPNTDLTVQGATTVTYQGVTANAAEALASVMSTGVIYGGVVTVASPTTFDVTAGVGFIINTYTTPSNPSLTRVAFSGGTGIVMSAASLARQVTAIAIDTSGAILQIAPPTNVQDRQYLIIGNFVQISAGVFISDPLQYRLTQPGAQLYDLMRSIGPFVASGNLINGIGGGLTFSRTGGQLFAPGSNTGTNRADPNVITTVLASPQSVRYATQIAGSTEAVTHTNLIPGSYDVGGVITAIPGGGARSTIQRLWYFTAGGGGVIVQYGQEWYSTLDEAILNMNTQSFVENPNLQYATLLGAIAIRKDATDVGNLAQAKFFSAVKLGGSFVGSTLGVTVLSVNGFTGNVVLAASDVGAIATTFVNAKGDLITATANDTPVILPVGTDAFVLTADSAQADGIKWAAVTDAGAIPKSLMDAKGDLIAATANDTPARLAVGTDGQYLRAASGQSTGLEYHTIVASDVGAVPTTRTLTAGTAMTGGGDLSTDRTFNVNIGTTAGTAAAGDDSRITDAQARSTLTTKGDLYVATTSATTARQAIGSDGQVLTADSGQTNGLKWAAATDSGAVPKSTVTTKGDLIVATASATVTRRAVGTDGQVLTADSAQTDGVKWATAGTDAGAQQRSTLTTKGDLYVATASATTARQGVGTNGYVVVADSAQTNGLKWATEKSFSFMPRSTGYISANGVTTARSSKAATQNTMFLLPFMLLIDATTSSIAFEVTGNVATAVVRLGFYALDATTLLPTGAAVVDFGTTTADTTTTKTFAAVQALTAGGWALAFVGQTAAPTIRHCAGFNPFVASATFPAGTGLGWNNGWVQTGVSGGLPTIGSLADSDTPMCGIKF